MSTRALRSVALARTVVRETRARDVPTFAASVAYYAFVSLVPLLALALIVAAAVGGEALEATVADLAGRYLLPTGRELVVEALRETRGRGSATLLGLAALAWSTLRLFRGLDVAFSRVYGSYAGGLVSQVRDGVVVLFSVAAGVLAVVGVVGALAALVGRSALAGLVAPISVGFLAAAFFPLYYVFPDVDVGPREVLPGTLLAAVGWALLGTVFGAYAAYAGTEGRVAFYGLLGGLVLLVTWFYFAGLVLLVGAVTNAALAGRLDRQVQHPVDRQRATMSEEAGADGADRGDGAGGEGAPTAGGSDADADVAELEAEVDRLRNELDELRSRVEDRTVHRDEIEADLRAYVRKRVRRGHARGWGPYLVLLYGTVMTLGAFYLLDGAWAVLAMVILFLSTLGLYVLFVLVGVGLNVLGTPRKAYHRARTLVDRVREFRN
ncbi:MAG: YhjD/YihY/BrkB family envelope integrity protein [Haloferacaceae archaeon]